MTSSSRSVDHDSSVQHGDSGAVSHAREDRSAADGVSVVSRSDSPLAIDRIDPLAGEFAARCPCCEAHLSPAKLSSVKGLYCPTCYGVFLAKQHFGELIAARRAERRPAEFTPVRPIDPQQYERRLLCPACRQAMEVHPYYGPGNVVIDSCAGCRMVWLDHGEIARIVQSEGGKVPPAKRYPEAAVESAEFVRTASPSNPLDEFFDALVAIFG